MRSEGKEATLAATLARGKLFLLIVREWHRPEGGQAASQAGREEAGGYNS